MKTVEIEVGDDGKVQVGLIPEQAEGMGEGAEKDYMRPVKDVEAAIDVVRDLLTGDTGDQAEAAENEEMGQGFGQVKRPAMMPAAGAQYGEEA